MVVYPEGSSGMQPRIGRAFRITMAWQAAASVAAAVVAGAVAGSQGFVSALLGGGIGVVGVLVFALVSRRGLGSSSSAVRVALRAEGAKVLAIVVLLWLAFVVYRDMVVLAFLGAFVVSVLLSGLAFAVSGDQLNISRV
jgi:F0F1-type ATP synthase assembly protein I